MVVSESPRLLTTEEAAARLRITPEHLRVLRHRGTGPRAVEISTATIRYDPRDLDAWIEERKQPGSGDEHG